MWNIAIIVAVVLMIASICYMAIIAGSKKQSINFEMHEMIFTPMFGVGMIILVISILFKA